MIAFDLDDGLTIAPSPAKSWSRPSAPSASRGSSATPRYELLFYICHGLLHLCGWDDADPAARERMHARQDEYLAML